MKILINGPAGGGKSVLVRKVMSLFDTRATIWGGVGGLPLAYALSHSGRMSGHTGRLQVLGNYETSLRDHHGLAQFNRYKSDFINVLKHAMTVEYPVLCEGGFLHPRRLDNDVAEAFCEACTVVWLSPPEARESAIFRRGRDLGDDSYNRHVNAANETMLKMVGLGAKWIVIEDRDEALAKVCEMIDPMLDPTLAIMPPQDKR